MKNLNTATSTHPRIALSTEQQERLAQVSTQSFAAFHCDTLSEGIDLVIGNPPFEKTPELIELGYLVPPTMTRVKTSCDVFVPQVEDEEVLEDEYGFRMVGDTMERFLIPTESFEENEDEGFMFDALVEALENDRSSFFEADHIMEWIELNADLLTYDTDSECSWSMSDSNLEKFLALVASGQAKGFYGDVLSSDIFLQDQPDFIDQMLGFLSDADRILHD